MKKESFIQLLNRSTPNEILDFIKLKGKGPKSVCPIIFFDEEKPKVDTNLKNYSNAEEV